MPIHVFDSHICTWFWRLWELSWLLVMSFQSIVVHTLYTYTDPVAYHGVSMYLMFKCAPRFVGFMHNSLLRSHWLLFFGYSCTYEHTRADFGVYPCIWYSNMLLTLWDLYVIACFLVIGYGFLCILVHMYMRVPICSLLLDCWLGFFVVFLYIHMCRYLCDIDTYSCIWCSYIHLVSLNICRFQI